MPTTSITSLLKCWRISVPQRQLWRGTQNDQMSTHPSILLSAAHWHWLSCWLLTVATEVPNTWAICWTGSDASEWIHHWKEIITHFYLLQRSILVPEESRGMKAFSSCFSSTWKDHSCSPNQTNQINALWELIRSGFPRMSYWSPGSPVGCN